MTMERIGEGTFWPVTLEEGRLVVGGLELDLESLSGAEPRYILVYSLEDGSPTLEATTWLGAEIFLPGRPWESELVETVETEEGPVPVMGLRMGPLNPELVVLRLFPLQGKGGHDDLRD